MFSGNTNALNSLQQDIFHPFIHAIYVGAAPPPRSLMHESCKKPSRPGRRSYRQYWPASFVFKLHKLLDAMLGTPSGTQHGGWRDSRNLLDLLIGEAIVYHNLVTAP